jgi:dCTP deaminase
MPEPTVSLPGVKPDRWIRQMAREQRMIEPFVDHQVRDGVISYGLSSYGYDVRVADEFRLLDAAAGVEIDPKRIDETALTEFTGEVCVIPGHSLALGRTLEYLRIPRDVITICFGKSTYARAGILINVTPFEPEWEGFATLAIVNTTPLPVRVHAGEGIAQILFLGGAGPCDESYADKRGKYQAQRRVTLSRL